MSNYIGTGILEVLIDTLILGVHESQIRVADRCIGLESVAGVQNRVEFDWNRNSESLRVSRNSQIKME